MRTTPDARRPSAHRCFDGCGWRDGWSTTTATAPCARARTSVRDVWLQSPWRRSRKQRTIAPMLILLRKRNISKFYSIPANTSIFYQYAPIPIRSIPMPALDAIDRKIAGTTNFDDALNRQRGRVFHLAQGEARFDRGDAVQ